MQTTRTDATAPTAPASAAPSDADAPAGAIPEAIPEQRDATSSPHIIARPADPPVHSGQTIAAVERALDVLLLFGTLGRGDLGVTEIAAELNMSKAAAHRVLSSLRSRGLVVLDPANHRYSLGAASLALGRAFLEQLDVRRLALPEMARLADAIDETVILSVRTNDLQMYVEQVLPQRELRMEAPVGTPIPLHTGSAGKVFLAHFTDEDVDAYIERSGLKALTEFTITDSQTLRDEVTRVRDAGFATSLGERESGAASVAAPILDDHGRPAAVLAIAGPTERMRDRLDDLALPLLDVAAALSQRLGWVDFGS